MLKFRLRCAFVAVLGGLICLACVLCSQARAADPQNPDDKTIVTGIQSSPFADPVLKLLDIHVASQDGVVTLSGTVSTDVEKGDVEHIASQDPGVKQVIDNLAVSGQSSAGAPAASSTAASPPAPVSLTVPAGTPITVQMIDAVDSATNKPGDEFNATVYTSVVVGNYVAIPQFSKARLRLVNAASAGHIKGRSELALELVSLTVNGTLYEVESNYYEQQGKSRGKQTAERTAGGGLLGGLLGAAFGRGKGAGIGAAAGAATGVGVQAATKGQQVKVASEAKVDFTLKAPVTIASVTPINAVATVAPSPPSANAAGAAGPAQSFVPPPPTPSANGLAGQWFAHYQGAIGTLRVSVRQTGLKVVGTVVGGDSTITGYLPVGKMMFYGTYNPGGFGAQEICADVNYTNPRWVPVSFKVIDNDHMEEDLSTPFFNPCGGYPVIWERVQ